MAVSNAAVVTVYVSIGFTRTLTDSDVALFESLGGVVTRRFDFINGLSGILPDAAIPMLRARSDVGFVEGSGFTCLAAN
ncbi:MAG: hypothetical protein ACE5HT_12335 [Gemmatimonadales bacterium]